MSLKNAAVFLFAAAIVNLLSMVIRHGTYLSDMGSSFYNLSRGFLLLLALVESVIFLILGLSYKKLEYNPATRKVTAIMLSVVSGIWIVYYFVDFADRVDHIRETAIDYIIWIGLIVFMAVSQLLLGIMIARGKTVNIRKAALPVAITAAAWALFLIYHQVMSYYHFGLDEDNQLRHMADLMNIVLPTAIFFWGLALFRSKETGIQDNTAVIDQL